MIRQASPTDAHKLSELIILAMGDLAVKFVNGQTDQASKLFEHFATQTGNQYSFENALIWEDEAGICGMILGYDGVHLDKLRAPFLKHLELTYNFEQRVEDETQAGEYYIDCLSVFPGQQGKGIGKKLIKALTEKAALMGYFTTGLLVNKTNVKAKTMYTSLGFEVADIRNFMGDVYEHLQYVSKTS
ncbi:GNAT family N-acetyltransferase [Mucilaginibacter sp. FT3.2]|uniref:GNAT family N-acetyltransferase n=1 Tax=Mucilaginibacter sp. FT3.2 TaxID=2723090 RepID=UPI0016090264|nr:GNAT family N-acetyltransferase [Mucilaginibacter sp. FT3.2]MBB6235012.1 ribosomal protein S18 acetylase RimI-like enzyme [Mucilaginibacter sp. FT3.2]